VRVNKQFPKLKPGKSESDVQGKRIAIIGGTGGLGRALAQRLAANGAKVLVVGQTFRDQGVAGIDFIKADLSSMSQAKRVAQQLPAETLDILIFTAGIFASPQRQETAEGLERDMAVSYLNRLLILGEVAQRLGSQSRAVPRVFIMAYPGSGKQGVLGDLNSELAYKAMEVHMNTVAGNEMLVLDAAQRYGHFTTFGLNPGLIKTNIRSNFMGDKKLVFRLIESLIGWFSPSAEQYAERITPLLLAPELDKHSGALFDRKGRALMPTPGIDTPAHMGAFLQQSRELIDKALLA
jgi:NAD(P)-dependent dehydrogenase (short-subunit alcohol dehydrogenase family)